MREYELIFIANPDLDSDALNDLVNRVQNWVTDGGGEVTKIDLWGKKKLTYIIRKHREGHYVFLHTKMAPTFLAQLERNLRLAEPILRFSLVTK